MKSERLRWVIALFLVMFCAGFDAKASPVTADSTPGLGGGNRSASDKGAISARFAELPLRFEANHGQFDAGVSFLARGAGYSLFLTQDGATLALHRDDSGVDESRAIAMRVAGARKVQPSPSETLPGTSNYFVGNDASKWRTGVESYARVRYKGVLPGVEVVFYGTGQRRLEYDVVLAPGADPAGVALAFEGAESVDIDGAGAAVLRLPGGGEIVQPAPVAYQRSASGTRESVDVRYERRDGALGFAVGRFDAQRALVIDPTLVYSTYLGGSGNDSAYGVAVDSAGEAFVTGSTSSTNFPLVAPFQGAVRGTTAFVTKFNTAGSALVYSTYLGGSGNDVASGIAVDAAGEAFVTGSTSSTDFPVASPFQSANRTAANSATAFVTKLNAAGSALVYSTYLGGSGGDYPYGIALDPGGEAFVAGYTWSSDFPTASPFQSTNPSPAAFSAFVTKLNAAGSALAYSTYLGGGGNNTASAIAVDSAGEAFVTGWTSSADFPLSAPAIQGIIGGSDDAFVTKFGAAGSTLVYSTYLGGGDGDYGSGIAVDSAGEAFVTGVTNSTNFPTASPYQRTNNGAQNGNAFVTKFDAAGSAFVYSTYLGGSGGASASGIGVDSAGEAFVTGSAGSNFPTFWPLPGSSDLFITKFNAAGSELDYSSYLGGSGASSDGARGIALDSAGDAFVVGSTSSTNFPTVSPLQSANAGGYDAFVAKVSPKTSTSTAAPAIGSYGPLLTTLLLLGGLLVLAKSRLRGLVAV